jgi:hypothetical protein
MIGFCGEYERMEGEYLGTVHWFGIRHMINSLHHSLVGESLTGQPQK